MPTYAHIQTDQTDAWYRVLRFTDLENPTVAHETYIYLDDLADMHRTALMQRLWNLPDLATSMLADMKHPQETLEEKGILYVNKVGGFYPDPSEQDIVEVVECPQRPRTTGEGFTGWLTSEGLFFERMISCLVNMTWILEVSSSTLIPPMRMLLMSYKLASNQSIKSSMLYPKTIC